MAQKERIMRKFSVLKTLESLLYEADEITYISSPTVNLSNYQSLKTQDVDPELL
jgi:hypothetical protein